MSTSARNGTSEVARFVAGIRWDDLPDDLLRHCQRSTLDCLGVALGAYDHPSVRIVKKTVDYLGGNRQARIWGSSQRTSVAHAALVNGFMAHVLDFDDSYVPEVTVLHANAAVIPAALALAEAQELNGGAYVMAYLLGYEVAARLALTAGAKLYGHLHVTALTGGFGATAAVAKLLGLGEAQVVAAFGIANAQAGASGQVLGTMTKALHAGRAAMSGIYAGLLAADDFTSAADALTGRGGFNDAYPSDQDYGALLEDLGTRWELRRMGYKPYACGVVQHALIDGIGRLRQRHQLRHQDVEAIEGSVTRYVLRATGRTRPADELEAKFSAYHSAAVMLIDGVAGPLQYEPGRVLDPVVMDLRSRVTLTVDETLAADQARVRVRLRDGTVLEEFVEHASGSAENPMTDEMVEAKFRLLAEPVLGVQASRAVVEAVQRIDRLDSMRELTDLLVPAAVGFSGHHANDRLAPAIRKVGQG